MLYKVNKCIIIKYLIVLFSYCLLNFYDIFYIFIFIPFIKFNTQDYKYSFIHVSYNNICECVPLQYSAVCYSVSPKKGDEGKLYYFYITLKSRTWTWATTVLYLSTAHNNSEHSEATHRSILNAMEKFTTNDIHNTIHASIFLLIPNSQQSLSASNWLSVSAYTCQYVVFQK